MDIKRLVTALSTGLALIVLYYAVVLPWIDREWGVPAQPAESVAQTQPSLSSTTEASSQPATQATTQPGVVSTISAGGAAAARIVPSTQPSIGPVASTLGSDRLKDSQFALQINVQALGAGLDSVVLNSFNKTARGKHRYVFQKPLEDRLDTAPLGSRSITVNGSTYDLAGVQWSLISATAIRVIYGADLVQKGDTLLRLTKTYQVFPRSNANEGYEIHVAYGFENTSGSLETLSTEFNGPTLPPPETNRAPDRQAVGGYVVDKNVIAVDDHPIEGFKPSKNNGEVDLTKDSKGHPVRWAGAVSNYFAAVVLPQDMLINGKSTNPNYLASIVAHGVNIDAKEAGDHQAYLTFKTTDLKLPAGQSAVIPLTVYFGPKWRNVLDAAHYTAYPRHYDLLDIIRTSECGLSFCSIQWLNSGIGWLLRLMHAVFRDWGLAIVGLVAIVRVILHPITRQSQISMARMGKMGPEMERLKKKYGDDKDALNKAMVEFHREQGLGPYLGCLPMFLQMPIWIALYGVLESTFELRQAPFLGHLTWIHDLARPDQLIAFSHPVKILFFTIHGFNLLPLLLSAAMLAQQQFMPKPVAASADQMKQQKMMQMLSPVMFLFFFYSLPSGLNLYIFTSTAVGVIESKLIRDHLKQKEEAEKAGRVLVETKATRGSKQARLNQADAPKKKSAMRWLGGQWASLLERAEQFRQEQDKAKNGKKK